MRSKVFPQVSEDRGTGTRCQFHIAPSRREVRNYPMACDRIEGVLQVVFHTQKTLGFSEEPTCDGGRIPPYYQNADGEVEGMSFPSLLITLLFDALWQANDWRALSRLYHILVSLFIFILLDRDHDGTSYKNPLIPSPDCASHRIY
jgi:hypothetical protein